MTSALFRALFASGLGLALCVAGPVSAARESAPNRRPVKAVGDQRLQIRTAAGSGALVLYASRPLADGAVQADLERAVLVLHGRLRDADVYFRSAQSAARAVPDVARHTLLVVPQFLAERDVVAHSLAPDTLRWRSATRGARRQGALCRGQSLVVSVLQC